MSLPESKSLTLIKLGGSIITDKSQPDTLRPAILSDLIAQISQARVKNPTQLFLIAHGQGSFAHVPAKKYETKKGLIRPDSVFGMAMVLDSVRKLNQIVVHECVSQNLPAVSWASSQSIITQAGGQPGQSWLKVLEHYLDKGFLPVTCGDVVIDQTQGCAIWSGETILAFLARELAQQGYKITQLIQVGEVGGVLDNSGKVIPVLTSANWALHQAAVTDTTKGFDVTGGMLLKVEESLSLAKETGIESWILAGLEPNNLYRALVGESWLGTKVTI